MLRPVIFIGCGGSGTKAIRYVRDAVLRRLEHRGWERGMPDAWQFIGLDTLTYQESPTEIPTIPAADFLSLSAAFESYRGLQQALEMVYPVGGDIRSAGSLCGWLPDPADVNIPLKDGAGQNRGIGRAAGLLSLDHTLRNRLESSLKRASAGGPVLREVGGHLGVDSELGGATASPLVVVCSSMAGGTGAGVALDVVDLVRACDPTGAHPTLVLFTNDIFDLPNQRPMAANSLGLMSETLAAYWANPGETKAPINRGAVQDPGVGPHSIFLVGRYSFRGADLGDTAEVYRATGEALSTWVVDDAVQERIHNFINVNWRNSAKDNHGGYPFGRDHQFGAISSFGAAKLTVGRDRFSLWAEHLLARQTLESLSEGHLRLSRSAEVSDGDTEEEVVQKLGDLHAERIHGGEWAGTATAAGSAKGCSSAASAFAPDAEARRIRREVLRELSFPAEQQASGAMWEEALRRSGHRLRDKWHDEALSRQDAPWQQAMLEATCRSVSEVTARSSLSVAAAALKAVAERLNPATVNEIRKEANTAEERHESLIGSGLDSLRNLEGELAGDAPQVQEAADSVAQGIAHHWRALRLRTAADVLEAAGEQVFGAIRRAVLAANEFVGNALNEDEVKGWPSAADDISIRYMHSTVEFPLEESDGWPAQLAELCADARVAGVPYGTRDTDHVRFRLIAGDDEIEPILQPREHQRWQPGQLANVACLAETRDIEARVHAWTRRSGGTFHRVITEGLRSYLQEDDPETGERRVDHSNRLRTFREKLAKAKDAADPLLSVSKDLYGLTNNNALEPFLTVCSQFPFGEGHPAEEAALAIVGDVAYKASARDDSSVLVSSYVRSPMHAMAVRSFVEPVSKALQQSLDPSQRASEFWMWRRGRTLDAFVPVPREALRAMVAGFAVARLCGYVTADTDRAVRITAAPDEAQFPWPLLTKLRHGDDLLAALLESFSLTFGTVASEGMGAYESYRRLHTLGEPALYGSLPPDLAAMLTSGSPTHRTVASETPKASGHTEAARNEAARRYLDLNLAYFHRRHPDHMTTHLMRRLDGSTPAGALTTELAPIFIDCYERLLDLVSGTGQQELVT